MNSETDFSAQKIQTGRELDLSGLKLVYGGLILQLISLLFTGRLASALMNGTAGSGVVSFVINAVALCLILAGLSRAGAASPFFLKARKSFLVQLVMQIILIVFFAGLGIREWTVGNIAYTPRSTLLELLVAVLAILVVSILARMISTRALLRGCGHVAEQTGDPLFSLKCMKNWRLWYMAYLLMILMALAGVAVIVTVLRKTIENGTSEEELTQAIFTNVSSSVLLVSIVVMAVLIFFLIAHILYIGKIRAAYREYHLEAISDAGSGMQRPALADYVQRELGEQPNDTEAVETEETWEAEEDEIVSEPADGEDTDKAEDRRIAGRRYRRIETETDEEEPDSGDLLEIAKMFKKK